MHICYHRSSFAKHTHHKHLQIYFLMVMSVDWSDSRHASIFPLFFPVLRRHILQNEGVVVAVSTGWLALLPSIFLCMFWICCLLCCKYLVFCAAAAMPPPSLLAVCWPSFNSSFFASHPSYFFVARLMALHRTFWRSEGTQRHLFVFSLQHTVPFFAAFQTLHSSVLEKETAVFSSADAAAKDRKKKRKNCNRKVISSAVFKSTTQKDRQTERKRHSPSTQVQHTHTLHTVLCCCCGGGYSKSVPAAFFVLLVALSSSSSSSLCLSNSQEIHR